MGCDLWERLVENQDHQCHIGFGLGRMDAGFANTKITVINAKPTESTPKLLFQKSKKENGVTSDVDRKRSCFRSILCAGGGRVMNDYKEMIGELKEQCPAIDYDCCELAFRAADAIEQLVKERDALLCDFLKGYKDQVENGHGIFRCDICKHGIENAQENKCQKTNCNGYTNWEWRGVRGEENVR